MSDFKTMLSLGLPVTLNAEQAKSLCDQVLKLERDNEALKRRVEKLEDYNLGLANESHAKSEEIEALKSKLKEGYRHEARLEDRITELNQLKLKRFGEEDYWIFQDDGEDNPESLVCPVTMSASKLRELLACRDEVKALKAEREQFATEQKIQALEELREQAYQKRADMLIKHNIHGSTCKRIVPWLDYEISKLKANAGGEK